MPSPHLPRLALIALALAAGDATHAENSDTLRLLAAVGITHDSNLFRLSSNDNPQALIGKSSAAETITNTSVGVDFNKAYSLQRVELNLNYVKYNYQNFDYLNFSALNYRAAWRWSYTPHFYGNVSRSHSETLNSFSDARGFERNERVDTKTLVDATYEVDARWRVLGGVTQFEQLNRRPLIAESSFRQDTINAGLRYEFPSRNSATLTLKKSDGSYLDRPLSTASAFDNRFTQNDVQAEALWVISPRSSADFSVGHRSRNHPNFPQRDFSGVTGNAALTYAITAKTGLIGGWTRDVAAYQTSSTNFLQIDRVYIGPVWEFSPKTRVSAQLASTMRDFRGSPGTTVSQRRDTYQDASLNFTWEPERFVVLSASVRKARRSSNQPDLDFNSNVANVYAQFAF